MMKKVRVNCETCGNRIENIYSDCPQIWVCENCKIEGDVERCEVCGLYFFQGDGKVCYSCKIDEEYRYRMAVGDIELELE